MLPICVCASHHRGSSPSVERFRCMLNARFFLLIQAVFNFLAPLIRFTIFEFVEVLLKIAGLKEASTTIC
jgi:hypothetical protein